MQFKIDLKNSFVSTNEDMLHLPFQLLAALRGAGLLTG